MKFAKNSNQKKLVSIKMGDYSVSLSLLNKTKKNNSSMKQEKKAKIEDLTAASKASQKIYYENILLQRHQTVHIFLKIGTDILPMLPIPLIMLIRRIPDMHSDSAALQRFLRK